MYEEESNISNFFMYIIQNITRNGPFHVIGLTYLFTEFIYHDLK